MDFLLDWSESGRSDEGVRWVWVWMWVWEGATVVPWEIEESRRWERLVHALRIEYGVATTKIGRKEVRDRRQPCCNSLTGGSGARQ